MSDQPKPRPPDAAQLVRIRDRLKGLTPGRWAAMRDDGRSFSRVVSWLDGTRTYSVVAEVEGRNHLEELANLEFIAHAPADILSLLAALDHAADLIHDLQCESAAYGGGVMEGRRQATSWLRRVSEDMAAKSEDYNLKGNAQGALLAGERSRCLDDMATILAAIAQGPPDPPAVIREENARLRAALERVAQLGSADVAMDLHQAGRIAREALGGTGS